MASPIRLLHTADWQLGALPRQLGEHGTEARRLRFEAAARVVELAHRLAVDLVVLAGDTFDSPDLDQELFEQGLELLEGFAPLPVALLPGNHDPLVEGGLWQRQAWRRVGGHLRVLAQAEQEVAVREDLVLYPCPPRQRLSRRDPTAWIPARAPGDRRTRIGVAHGALSTLGVASNFPIDSSRAERAGLDYLALGDWHGLSLHGRTAYPGTIEPTGFGEQRPGHVLLVEIEPGSSAPPRLEPFAVGRLEWRQLRATLCHPSDVEAIRRELLAGVEPGALVARLRLCLETASAASPEHELLQAELRALYAELEASAFHLDWQLEELPPRHAELPPGLLSLADAWLLRLEQTGASAAPVTLLRPPLAERAAPAPEVVREARALLHQLVRGDV